MSFQINPPRTRLVDAQGLATPEFYRFLVQIQRITGGVTTPFDDSSFLNSPPINLGESAIDDPLVPPAIPAAPEDAFAPPPVAPQVADDPLPPPPAMILRDDDLLYPPRYGI